MIKKSNLLFAVIAAFVMIFSSCKKKEDVTPQSNAKTSSDVSDMNVQAVAYTIKLSDWNVDNKVLKIPAGSVIVIEPGVRGNLLLKNFVGTPTKPYTFINGSGGQVQIKLPKTNAYGFKTEGCKYIRVTGTGTSKYKYGIQVNGANIGMSFDALSTNWEVDNCEVLNTNFAGIMGKTDPSCDKSTWRGNFTMRDVKAHDNYVHDTGGEGFYIGNSFYANGKQLACGTILPHSVEGAKVYNNITKSTGCEGIQVGCAISGLEIYNNSVEKYGSSPFANNQNNGIQVGEGSGGKCYNNIVKNGPGNGIIVLGYGDNVVFNNLVLNTGENGVFVDTRYTPGPGFTFLNNTIIAPGKDGFKVYAEKNNVIKNNIVVKPGTGKFITTKSAAVRVTDANNLFTNDINSVKFVGAAAQNYKLAAGSPAIDKGANVSTNGVNFDNAGGRRPIGAGFDIGAFEYGASGSGGAVTTPTKPSTPTTPSTGTSVTFKPTDDIYLEKGKRFSYVVTKVEGNSNQRVTYIKFNVANVRTFKKAVLKLKEDTFTGSGNVRVYKGSHSNWTENNITSANAPKLAGQVASLNTTFTKGAYYQFDVSSMIKANGTYTLVLTMDSGKPGAVFSTKEGSFAPQLIIN